MTLPIHHQPFVCPQINMDFPKYWERAEGSKSGLVELFQGTHRPVTR